MSEQRPLIVCTNDDGIQSPGLWAAAQALETLGEVLVVAPRQQQTAAGRGMPITNEGRIYRQQFHLNGQQHEGYAVDASPAQAVIHALLELVNRQPALLVSGINYGENAGSGITASGTVASYQATVSQIQMRSNVISIFEDARLSGVSSAPPSNPLQTTILAIMVGAALAMGLALLIEYVDDSIRTPAQANDILAIPTMAAIPRFGNRRSTYSDKLITYHKPSSPLSEEYRTLRTHLLYSMNGNSVTYIISSASPGEGKTITSANLAVTMANAGWRVLLIDADLRRPRQHDVFQLDNHVGLSTLLSTMPSQDGADLYYELSRRPELQGCIKDTQVPGLQVITSGPIPLNPVEVLGSAAMHRWFECFVSSPDINIILFDTPPVLVSADAAVVSSVVDAPVIMVLEAGKTRPGGALRAKERLESLNVAIKGLVLNSVSSRDMKYYGDYYQYYYYYRDAEQTKQPERN